jgi:aldose 1-epimerase
MSENSLFLRSATTEVEIWPARGGSIGQFVSTTPVGDWCWLVSDHDLGVACFPLVPFASRIRASAFDFDGRRVTLPPNNPPEPHAIHGHGWQTPWQVLDAARDSARLGYRHEADAWPWSYEAQQRFRLQEACLEVELLVRNASPHPMPLGMGLHPYFPLTPETHLEAKVSTIWRMDEELALVFTLNPSQCDLARLLQ